MAFWYRMKQSHLKTLSNHFKRSYFFTPNSIINHPQISSVNKPNWFLPNTHFEIGHSVRFFAAPVQVKPKQEDKDSTGPRLNTQITSASKKVRLVTDAGHEIVFLHEALSRSRSLKLDLVEVQRTAEPPVCKIMDYHKEKYMQQLKEKDRSKSKSEVTLRKGDCKEVRFTCKIDQKDLQMKADMVRRLMERGYRVKCMAMGTEEQDLEGLLSRLSAMIDDFSIVESGPRVEKKQAYVLVRHVKFGPTKKGTSKKSSSKPPKVSVSDQILASDEISDGAESGLEEAKDFDQVFDIGTPEMSSTHTNSFSKTPTNSPSEKVPIGIENRYKRDPRNVSGLDVRDSARLKPQFPNPSEKFLNQERSQSPSRNFGQFTAKEPNNIKDNQGESAVVNRYKKTTIQR